MRIPFVVRIRDIADPVRLKRGARAAALWLTAQVVPNMLVYVLMVLAKRSESGILDWAGQWHYWFTSGTGALAALTVAGLSLLTLMVLNREASEFAVWLVAVLLTVALLAAFLTPAVLLGHASLHEAQIATLILWSIIALCGAWAEGTKPTILPKEREE